MAHANRTSSGPDRLQTNSPACNEHGDCLANNSNTAGATTSPTAHCYPHVTAHTHPHCDLVGIPIHALRRNVPSGVAREKKSSEMAREWPGQTTGMATAGAADGAPDAVAPAPLLSASAALAEATPLDASPAAAADARRERGASAGASMK